LPWEAMATPNRIAHPRLARGTSKKSSHEAVDPEGFVGVGASSSARWIARSPELATIGRRPRAVDVEGDKQGAANQL
jgi:hypothetical protein